ncbi:sulfotransferase [uncultured Halopseudomonas sp.]|uniref:sulfotransferase family protein n=1 Tax=uncultured Halopseudomonas sp. TaxID=2901193 RepID=UPI0030EF1879|tara:strand:- start:10677 stop:11663 length:987 start_codon:yes stop_codon:yes gene_type:complete
MIAQLDKTFIKLSKRKTYTRLLCYFFEGRPLTTKGRWINPFVFTTFKLFEKVPFARKIVKPLYIVGTGRSGTTILGLTLSIHKDIAFLNEPKAYWNHIIDNEDLIGSYSKRPGQYYINPNEISLSKIIHAHRILGNFLTFSKSKRLVDKYPELIFRFHAVKRIHPDSKFLFLYRDGWDTCHSIETWSKRLGTVVEDETHDWWGRDNQKWFALQEIVKDDPQLSPYSDKIADYRDHRWMAAVEWILTMKQGIKLLQENPDCVLAVKYEEFVADKNIRDNILDFCDLDRDQNFDDYCNETLTLPSPKKPIELPDEIRSEFHRIMKELGYE